MKANIIEYKGYHTVVEFDSEDLVLRGKIEGIDDYVDFECEDAKEVEKEFHNAVDEYLIFCEEVGKDPQKEYKGVFNVRINPESHRKIALKANKEGKTLNALVEEAIEQYISRENVTSEYLKNIEMIQEQFNIKWGAEKEENSSKVVSIKPRIVDMKYKEALRE